ncbi:unnamed protein product [Soboliphyme baturini]|uniref:Elongator complex protein 6 n=1 Tax=Soboliphyme baturini TaxID=241478 RepID=A0A183IKY3_9BILA|nr:unnamed protein product [Soboliphyme baturini]
MMKEEESKALMKAVLWVSDRRNYVCPLKTIHWYLVDPSVFILLIRGNCYVTPVTSALQLLPTSIKVDAQSTSWRDLYNQCLSTLGSKEVDRFLDKLRCVHVTGARADQNVLATFCKRSLCAFEFYDTVLSDDDQTLVVDLLSNGNVKALGFGVMAGDLLNRFCQAGRLNVRVMRFAGPQPLKVSILNSLKVEMPCVELLSLQELTFDERPMSRVFFRGIGRFFKNLKCLLLDWTVVSPAVEYSESTKQILAGLKDVYVDKKLQALVVLIYCPDDALHQAAAQITAFFSSDKSLKYVRHFDFATSTAAPANDNFRLIIIGSPLSHFSERLKKVIVDDRCTQPDLRHLCYVVDQDPYLDPDLSLAFGGFDEAEVRAKIANPSFMLPPVDIQ